MIIRIILILLHGVRSAMASNIHLQPPEQFDFAKPDTWIKWKRRFEPFQEASGLSSAAETRQVSTLLYTMGENADNVLTSTGISDDDRKKYKSVIEKFDRFFQVRRNVIFERAKFNRRNQLPGESVEQYITELYSLVETCEYGDLTEDMLRDRIVVGIRDVAIAKHLQLDAELTLEKAKQLVRQNEAVQDNQRQLKGDGSTQDPIIIDGVAGKHKVSRHANYSGRATSRIRAPPRKGEFQHRGGETHDRNPSKLVCTRCGHNKHVGGEKCPAFSATCHKCNKKGHCSTQCFSKTPSANSQTSALELSLDSAFLDAMTTKEDSSWNITVTLNNKPTEFKLDMGAAVTAISEETFKTLPMLQLTKPCKILSGPTRQKLNVLGQFTATLSHNNTNTEQEVFVIQGLQNNLLGLPAITALQLLCRIQATYAEDIFNQFHDVFTGLGNLGDEYHIKLEPEAQPVALHTSRNVPLPLRAKVQDELNRMEQGGVILKVDDPTPWCSGIVVVPKKLGAIRICVDLKKLNENVLREVHPLPKVEETLALLAGATVFSKLDANSGFWQIPLAKESRLLTTFITPFGRYCFNKLPFGITSAPELFQKRMKRILDGLKGVVCQMNDILIFGSSQEEHDSRLLAVLKRLRERNVTLNSDKCEFNKKSVKFLGQLIDSQGIRADPDKTSALDNMKVPSCVSDLRRFLGMANQLGKFSPQLAEVSQPLRELLSPRQSWQWGLAQDQAFAKVKAELVHPTVLALYDADASTKISADASSCGLGAVLLQKSNEMWKPVAYASRSMTNTESGYAQIEKKALAVTWACDKFADYIIGKYFEIESDHKPLIPLLNSKHLDHLPPRILCLRLRMGRYHYTVCHVPGKFLYTADTLSRAPLSTTDSQLQDVEWFVESVISALPAKEHRLNEYKVAQDEDPICAQVKQWCAKGWPTKCTTNAELVLFWKVRSSLTLCNQLLLFN